MSIVESPASLRLLRVYREAGRPLPRFSEDEVVDFCVTESLLVAEQEAKERMQEEDKRKSWEREHANLRESRGGVK